ncbi:rhomboid family intramembrane serine protease [Tropicimonas sp. IMCC34011]|uniref:rhomboid family intramembrane serine protease n=1 Tax=Tropicimonas sp. IMCC34011 TaxID=2248759 RepID=UPI000E229276|nr:rhomboid family intramembrane serine protease [Tropicimonas sp. IMCC34011]
MDTDHDASPFNRLPPVVLALAGAMFAVEIWFALNASGFVAAMGPPRDLRIFALERFAFSGEIFDWMLETRRFPPEHLLRFVSYPFVHGSFTHMVFVAVFVLALGKMVAEVFSPVAVAVIFFASAILGACAFGLLTNDPRPLFGGFPAAYGLIGSYTFLLWVGYGARGENRFRAFTLIGFLMGLQLIFGVLFGATNDWIAEITGFLTGFVLSGVLSPGGWSRLLATIRTR